MYMVLCRHEFFFFSIQQFVEVVEENGKAERLQALMRAVASASGGVWESKALIFTDTKRCADDITRVLRRDGWPALAIHGDKKQTERDWVLAEFKTGRMPIMIATDVASRGLDVKDVKYVINYDFPGTIEDYVHRIGRKYSTMFSALYCACQVLGEQVRMVLPTVFLRPIRLSSPSL